MPRPKKRRPTLFVFLWSKIFIDSSSFPLFWGRGDERVVNPSSSLSWGSVGALPLLKCTNCTLRTLSGDEIWSSLSWVRREFIV